MKIEPISRIPAEAGIVIVPNNDKTKCSIAAKSLAQVLGDLDDLRRGAEAKGVDVAARLKELGLEDDALFDNPLRQARPGERGAVGARRLGWAEVLLADAGPLSDEDREWLDARLHDDSGS